MSIKVKTLYYNSFNMPQTCVVCGHGSEPGMSWKVSNSKSNWSGKRTTTLSLEFPLCPECYTVSREKGGAKFLKVVGILVAIMLCLTTAGLVASDTIENPFLGWGIGIAVTFAAVFGINRLADSINQKGLTPEQRELRKRVKRSIRIKSFNAPKLFDKSGGSILFEFENQAFASAFSTLNLGQLSA